MYHQSLHRLSLVLLIVSSSIFISCKEFKVPDETIIEGYVKNLPDCKLYLTEAHYWQTPLYYADCINGHFKFKIKTDSSFVPYMATIHFPDSTKSTKVGGFLYRNHMSAKDSMKYCLEGFYVEKGYTKIEGDYLQKAGIRVFAGKETDVMYKNQFTDFGWLGNIDSVKRIQRINSFKKEIDKYPFSYFLLQSMYSAKEQYSEKEINEILELFDEDLRNSVLGKQFETWLVNKPEPDKPYPNLLLLNPFGKRDYIIDQNSKLTMLVFWASWCGPCRMEIPSLKEIHAKYKEKGLNIVSISIDDDMNNWTKALVEEKMLWPQYVVDKVNIEMVKQQFNFSAIPLVVFTDSTGKEIKKFTGYSEEQKKNYETVIEQFIN